jgi:hypothetical protein
MHEGFAGMQKLLYVSGYAALRQRPGEGGKEQDVIQCADEVGEVGKVVARLSCVYLLVVGLVSQGR